MIAAVLYMLNFVDLNIFTEKLCRCAKNVRDFATNPDPGFPII